MARYDTIPSAIWLSSAVTNTNFLGKKLHLSASQMAEIVAKAAAEGLTMTGLTSFTFTGNSTLVWVNNGTGSALAVPGGILVMRSGASSKFDVEPNATNNTGTAYAKDLVVGSQLFPIPAGEYGWAVSFETGEVAPVVAGNASATFLRVPVFAADSTAGNENGIEVGTFGAAGLARCIIGVGLANSTAATTPFDMIPMLCS
jgi:hypothetical protein